MKRIILMFTITSLFVFGGCKPEKKNFKVSFANSEHVMLDAICDGKKLKNDDILPQDSIIAFATRLEDFYKVETWNISGGTLLEGGVNDMPTARIKLTSDINVNVNAVFAAKEGYDAQTGIGCINGIAFEMKAIEEVVNGKIGYATETDNIERTVDLSPYRIGTTEVTQELWKKIMGKNPSYNQKPSKIEQAEKRPVEHVSWFEVVAFCNLLTERLYSSKSECVYYTDDNFTQVYTLDDAVGNKIAKQNLKKKGFRLPTTAEWEWAALAGTENDWAGTNDETELLDYAWIRKNASLRTHQVKTKKPNNYGLYDMTGNVIEFVWDYYYTPMLEKESAGKNPVGIDYATQKTAKGGSCIQEARQAYRYNTFPCFPKSAFEFYGFRLCCTK